MKKDEYLELLETQRDPEQFVRRALHVLEFDFRLISLVLLHEWDRLRIVSRDLFQPVTALQRPSWGVWNWLVSAILSSRRSVLRDGTVVNRDKVITSKGLTKVLTCLDRRLTNDWANRLKPLAELCRQSMGETPTLGRVLALPITLRNRIVHDNPTDCDWWRKAAAALAPVIEVCARDDVYRSLISMQQLPEPWFASGPDGGTYTFNGLEEGLSVLYVNRDGASFSSDESTHDVIQAFQRLLGKSNIQAESFRKLLAELAPEDVKGVLIGDFLLARPIGSGAFGVVHIGRQLSTGRTVAIKVLRDGVPDDAKVRFRQEAAFLSRLNSPHIVSVYSYGEDTWIPPGTFTLSDEEWFKEFSKGSPVKHFIAMEWIDGPTLEDVFNERPSERPSRDRITQWFIQAATALRTVHAAGLIHRDIKPSNLMVTADGQLKLMDFGIARSQHDARTLITSVGTSLGTPAYMSPEQLRASDAETEVGPRTDIYSLCATFYELYTHARIYEHDTESADSVRIHKMQGDRPRRPSRLDRTLPWELETILLGGLESDISDRYADISDLEADLRRFQLDEPVKYKRPSAARRAMLAYRRNRTVVNLVGSFLVLIGLGVAVYIRHISQERRRVETSLKVARETVDRFLTRVSEEQLLEQEGMQPLRKRLLQDALEFYRKLLKEHAGNEIAEESVARAFANCADIENMAGSKEAAIEAYKKALTYWNARHAADHNSAEVADELTTALWGLATVQRETGNVNSALANMEQVVSITSQLLATQPHLGYDLERDLLVAYSTLGPFQRSAGKHKAAKTTYQKAWKAYERFTSKSGYWGFHVEAIPGDSTQGVKVASVQRHTAAAAAGVKPGDVIVSVAEAPVTNVEGFRELNEGHRAGDSMQLTIRSGEQLREIQVRLEPMADHMMGVLALNAGILEAEVYGDFAEAMTWYSRAKQILERLEDLLPDDPSIMRSGEGGNIVQMSLYQTYSAIARAKVAVNKREDAIDLFKRSLAICREIAHNNPSVIEHQHQLVTDLANLGFVRLANGQVEEAETHLQEALGCVTALVAANPSVVRFRLHMASIRETLGGISSEREDYDAAIQNYSEALFALDERWRSVQPSVTVATDASITIAADASAEYADGSLRRTTATVLNNLGNCLFARDDLAGASDAFEAILNLYRANAKLQHLEPADADLVARAYGNLAWADILRKRFDSSIDRSTRALAVDPSQDWIRQNLALSYLLDGQFQRSRDLYLTLQSEAEDKASFAASLMQEFGSVQEKGLSHPDMKKIEKLFSVPVE